jgi:DEAD/DEAH box helicase domain-containing protein
LRKERDSLQKKVRLLRERIRRKEEDPAKGKHHQRELDELKREKSALQKLASLINGRDTFNFFTDEGFIPNYAFPEAGVQLRSIIYRKKQKRQEGEGAYSTWVYEYERPASSAIKELAPANHFYAGKRKVRVDQVDLSVSEVETWRLCNNCSHSELMGVEPEKTSCPNCGSLLWSDEGQKRLMVRLRQVFANTSDRESRIDDDHDDREPSLYEKQLLLDFSSEQVTDAYRLDSDEIAFGFEFLSKAAFREVNFGEKGEFGQKVTIAGVELPRKGFALCRYCGKVQDRTGKIEHARTCTSRSQESPQNLMDCVYLYRDFTSEAIRILLPVTTFAGSERKHHSFLAALQLGLKRKFEGSVDHLRVTDHEEPVPETSYRKKYLVVFDTVPGGTGYLKQLMRSEEPIMEVFQLAMEALKACRCNGDPDKDGCYQCLYAYKNSYRMTEISRDTAIELFSSILREKERLVKTDTLKNVKVNVLFDSELEARFIEALRRVRSRDLDVTLTKEVVNGKPGYFLKAGDRAYHIEPQVKLGPKDGVAVPSQADFVFWPARAQQHLKPVAVFTDGFLYHRERVGEDFSQRMAVVRSGRFLVWSLTWKDVENQFHNQGDYFQNFMDPGKTPGGTHFSTVLKGYELQEMKGVIKEGSFLWFMRLLANPKEDLWQRFAYACGLNFLDPKHWASPEFCKSWTDRLEEEASPTVCSQVTERLSDSLVGFCGGENEEAGDFARVLVAVEKSSTVGPKVDGMRLLCCLRDRAEDRQKGGFESAWTGMLRAINLFQFLPWAFVVSRQGIEKGLYEEMVTTARPSERPEGERSFKEEWEEVRKLVDQALYGSIDCLAVNHCPVPEPGYELIGETGEIIACAELAWEELKICLLREDEVGYQPVFEEAGWRVFLLAEVVMNPEKFCEMLNI